MHNLCHVTFSISRGLIIYPFKSLLARQEQTLQRKVKIVDESPWDTAAHSGALRVRTGTQDQIALAREAEEVLAEHVLHRFIEAHDIGRVLNSTALDTDGD